MPRSLVCVALLALVCTACGSSTAGFRPPRPGWARTGAYTPAIHPADFVPAVTNRYFPLTPGTTFRYAGRAQRSEVVTVTRRTKTILGVRATVVRDVALRRRRPIALTFDWYAQDRHGNVWFMGRRALDRRHGRWVRARGSWTAGVHGAKPGVVMRGHPHLGDHYRQELSRRGDALDQARVVALHPLTTIEWDPAGPRLERKVYVAGVGEVSARVTEGGHQAFSLVSVTRG
jgi:hypothetical protein